MLNVNLDQELIDETTGKMMTQTVRDVAVSLLFTTVEDQRIPEEKRRNQVKLARRLRDRKGPEPNVEEYALIRRLARIGTVPMVMDQVFNVLDGKPPIPEEAE